MTTPPSRLAERLIPGELFELRQVNGDIEAFVGYTDALAEIAAGAIEGVGPRSGKINYLRRLKPEAAMDPKPVFVPLEELYNSRSSAVTYTNIGTYKEELWIKLPNVPADDEGFKFAYCYAFCLLKKARW